LKLLKEISNISYVHKILEHNNSVWSASYTGQVEGKIQKRATNLLSGCKHLSLSVST